MGDPQVMDRRAAYGAVRLLPRLTSVGMFLVIALQLGRLITPGIGFIDVLVLKVN